MNGYVTDYVAGLWLATFGHGCWTSLHLSSPIVNGATQSEVSGGTYLRQPAAFAMFGTRTTWIASDSVFIGLPAAKISWIGFWDAQYNGHLLTCAPLDTPVSVLAGGSMKIAAHTYAVSLGVPS
jgi:hypothetical protein